MNPRLSYRLWILAGCLVVVICTLTMVGVVLERSLDEHLMDQARHSLGQQLILAREVISDRWRPDGDLADSERLAETLGHRLGLRVTLISPQGKVVGDSEVKRSEVDVLENHGHRPEVLDALSLGQGSSTRYSSTLGDSLMYYAGLLGHPQDPKLIIRLSQPLAGVEKALSATRRLVMGALLLGVLLSVVVAYLMAKGITRPVMDLTRIAQVMASGDLTPRVRRYPSHEIGDLGRAFDSMADSLQKQMQELLRAHERQEAVLRGMVEGVLLTDREGRITVANRALVRLLGLGLNPVGRTPSEVLRNHDLVEAMRQVQGGAGYASREIRILGPVPRYLEVHVVRVAGETPEAGAVAVFHDVTERRQVEQMRRDFVANVSHELRTPLTAIKASAETLLEGALESPPDARRFVEMIERQGKRLSHLVEDLLDLARLESGEAALHLESFSVREMMEGLLEEMAERAAAKDLELASRFPETPLEMRGDRQLLEQAVLNLLDNAIKYTGSGGKVVLGATVLDDQVSISVSDTGPGIAPHDQGRLFERFYRVDKDRSRDLGGTGLGLAIVKHIAQVHGGRVEVESRPGQGSTFRLVLPV